MPPMETISLVLQGGAVVVLLLWVWDLRKLREQERSERLANAEVMREVGSSLGELTHSINALIEGTRPERTRR